MKKCTKCGKVLPVDDFRVRSGRSGTRQSLCRRCESKASCEYVKIHRAEITNKRREYQKQYKKDHKKHLNGIARKSRRKNPQRHKDYGTKFRDSDFGRNSYLKRRYGITLEEFDNMKDNQDGKCAICGSISGKINKKNDRLTVDHDHSTGEVRGILCHKCNFGLGHFDDDIERLAMAIAYLKIYQQVSPNKSNTLGGKTIKGERK